MNKKDGSQNKPTTIATARMSKRCKDLDKLIAEHCKRKCIDRFSLEHQHARDFNREAQYLGRHYLYAIDGILANDPRELMICYVAHKEGLAAVGGFGYKIRCDADG